MWSIESVSCLLFLAICAGLDIRYKSLPAAAIGVAAVGSSAILLWRRVDWILAAGGILVGVFCLVVSKVTRQGLGYGDSLLILFLGACVGLWKLTGVLLIAFLSSAIFSIFLLTFRKKKRKYSYPFIPFLLLGFMGVMWL